MSPSTISCSTSTSCGSESRGPGDDGGNATGPAAGSAAGRGRGSAGGDGAPVDASPSGAWDNGGSVAGEAPPAGSGRPSQAVTAMAMAAPNTTASKRRGHRFIVPKVTMGYP